MEREKIIEELFQMILTREFSGVLDELALRVDSKRVSLLQSHSVHDRIESLRLGWIQGYLQAFAGTVGEYEKK